MEQCKVDGQMENFLNKIILGDCLEVMKDIPDNSIDLVITSPPYDNLRDYNNSLHWNMEIFSKIALEITRVLAYGGCIVWIVNDATIKGSETGTSFKQALYFKEICGLLLHDTMIWNKLTAPFQHKNRYINCFEYMFVFSKGRPKTTNIIKDRKNKWACTQIHGTERLPNGQTRQLSDVQKSKKVKEFGSRLNIWEINPEKNNKTGHPAVFPEKIAIDHILTWSNPGDVILDPFVGSGTTAIASLKTGRFFIGIEKEKEYYDIAMRRVMHNEGNGERKEVKRN